MTGSLARVASLIWHGVAPFSRIRTRNDCLSFHHCTSELTDIRAMNALALQLIEQSGVSAREIQH
jgi:hypothetical protein